MRRSRTYRLCVGRIVISIATAIPNTRHPIPSQRAARCQPRTFSPGGVGFNPRCEALVTVSGLAFRSLSRGSRDSVNATEPVRQGRNNLSGM